MMGRKDSDKVAIREGNQGGPTRTFLANATHHHKLWLVSGTLPTRCEDEQHVRSTSLVSNPAGLRVAHYNKIHLFNFVRNEERYDGACTTEPGVTLITLNAPCDRTSMSVCYNLRFPGLYRALVAPGNLSLILMSVVLTYVTSAAH